MLFYYQNFVNLTLLMNYGQVQGIYVSAFHFHNNNIYLNNNQPNYYNQMWNDIKEIRNRGIDIYMMLGGAGLAYGEMFKDFDYYYLLLIKTIKHYNISGIDIDIEESVNEKDVIKLLWHLRRDFNRDFVITMAPGTYELQINTSYRLYYKYVNWFNIQAYSTFDVRDIKQVIDNGYHPSKLVVGMISYQFDSGSFCYALDIIRKFKQMGIKGIYNWEYFDTTPNIVTWITNISNI